MRKKYRPEKRKKRRNKNIKKVRQILEFIFAKVLFVIVKRLPYRALFWTSATTGHLIFKIPLEIPFSSDPMMRATGFLKSTS